MLSLFLPQSAWRSYTWGGRTQRPHLVRLHFYDLSRKNKCAETKSKLAAACGWEGRKAWEVSADVYRSTFGVRKWSKMDFGDDCTTLEYTSKNTIKLYISMGGLHSTWIISQERYGSVYWSYTQRDCNILAWHF